MFNHDKGHLANRLPSNIQSETAVGLRHYCGLWHGGYGPFDPLERASGE